MSNSVLMNLLWQLYHKLPTPPSTNYMFKKWNTAPTSYCRIMQQFLTSAQRTMWAVSMHSGILLQTHGSFVLTSKPGPGSISWLMRMIFLWWKMVQLTESSPSARSGIYATLKRLWRKSTGYCVREKYYTWVCRSCFRLIAIRMISTGSLPMELRYCVKILSVSKAGLITNLLHACVIC